MAPFSLSVASPQAQRDPAPPANIGFFAALTEHHELLPDAYEHKVLRIRMHTCS